ncbi:hypothetical protein SCLCIDRAFT_9632 [Scleroderma citrinum Foug A]|uniref:DUF6532 domain-containing protein n=1 Tax=Scleroderma citrinum Foug A TaxID=1036808 RepID=A0A0C2ZG13_9AGAM|nr:hypothetical protein SCLCIDRAFT_9632 [Scleroderma citrinum Foug A]
MIRTQALQDTLIFLSDNLDSGIIPSKTLSSPLLHGTTLPPSSPSATTSSDSTDSSPEEVSSGRGSRRSSHVSRTFQPYPKPMLGESTAMHFAARALRGEEPKLSLSDHNKSLVLSEEALNAAVMMKHTGRETRHYCAIASAWEMQEAEQYHKFISLIHKSDRERYRDFDKLSLNKIIYEDDLESFKAADIQLNWLEEEVQSRLKSEGGEQEGKKMPVKCSSQSHRAAEEADDDDNNGDQDQWPLEDTTPEAATPEGELVRGAVTRAHAAHGNNVSGRSIQSQLNVPSEQPQLRSEYLASYGIQSGSLDDTQQGFWDELQFSTPSNASAPQIDNSLLQYCLPIMTNQQTISSQLLPPVGTSVSSQQVGDLQALFNSLVPTVINRPGEVVYGQRFEAVIHPKQGTTEWEVCKESNICLPPVTMPAQSTTATAATSLSTIPPFVVAPAQSTLDPSTDLVRTAPVSTTPTVMTSLLTMPERKRIIANTNTELLKYFISKPLRKRDEDEVYFAALANHLVSHLAGVNNDWITNYLKNFNTSARKTLREITATFKKTALSIIKDNYGVCLPIAQCNNYGVVCKVKADELLNGHNPWCFVDSSKLFDHPALTSLITDTLWPHHGKLYKAFLTTETPNIDPLIAYSLVILRWAIENLRHRKETDFVNERYANDYQRALDRIEKERWPAGA